jgi:recombinational DNA repair protein (RecF pathway)
VTLTPEQIAMSRTRLISEGFTPASPAVRVHDQLLALMAEAGRSEDKKLKCAFCQKGQDAVAFLIAGPKKTCICDECVHACSSIVDLAFAEKAKLAKGDAADIEAGQKLIEQTDALAESEGT